MKINRLLFGAACAVACALAGPPLTTVQDVLYKADGTRFSGSLTITWKSFQAADSSAIVTQSTSVKVVDGNLRVQLVPTTSSTPAVYYSVTYNSDGRVQFQETWSVPSSAQPVRVREVRVATASSGNSTGGQVGNDSGTPVAEADVVGLVADLGARPLKGPGFAAGRVTMVNPLGALEAVVGSPSDCVRVDGSSGPCGGLTPSFVDGDAPSGIVDGANLTFALSSTPAPVSSVSIYRNGLLMKPGQDYTLSGRTLQFVSGEAPQPGDTLLASYRLSGSDDNVPQLFPTPQVLCSGTGAATASTALTNLATCPVPAGMLVPGDRVEIRFDYEHQGTAGGMGLEIHWGATTALHVDTGAAETALTGRMDAAITASGARLSSQNWGAAEAFRTGVVSASDSYTAGLTVVFQGRVAQAGDTAALRGFTVVRWP